VRFSLGALVELLGPALLVIVVGLLATTASASNEVYFLNALVSVAIVVAIYVFVGISGVVSFGQISFVAVGAFAAGVMTVPVESKKGVLTTIFPILRDHSIGNVPSLLLAAALGGVFAFVVGMPLMRLSGLAAGIATFAVLEITHNVLREWTKIGPGATTLALVPETTGALQATLGALVAIVVAFLYQRSRRGRLLRASREDPAVARSVGVNIHLERLLAFTVSGALAGFAGALYVHLLGSITTEQVYLELTFLTLAMLVIGGLTSLWGAVVGALAVSGLDSFLSRAEQSDVHVIFTMGAGCYGLNGADTVSFDAALMSQVRPASIVSKASRRRISRASGSCSPRKSATNVGPNPFGAHRQFRPVQQAALQIFRIKLIEDHVGTARLCASMSCTRWCRCDLAFPPYSPARKSTCITYGTLPTVTVFSKLAGIGLPAVFFRCP